MKPDLTLESLHYHGLCTAIETGGVLCFNKKFCKGLCYKHYERVRKHGSVNLPPKKVRKCKFIDCDNIHFCNGCCKKHYRRKVKPKTSEIKCSVEGCATAKHSKGLCRTHMYRLKHNGDVNIVRKGGYSNGNSPPSKGTVLHPRCIVPGCDIKHGDQKANLRKGLCNKHYLRWLRHGDYNVTLISRKS